jgi:hypothetical protein
MRVLSTRDIIQIWELGRDKPGWLRGWLILAAAEPTRSPHELATLPLGVRNDRLLALRRDVVGASLHAYARCPACSSPLEFGLDVDAVRTAPPLRDSRPASTEIAYGDLVLQLRPLTSLDMADTTNAEDRHLALLRRSVVAIRRGGEVLSLVDVEQDVLPVVDEHMSDVDPGAVVRLALDCAACGHAWSAALDIGDFFWRELAIQAERLLTETHTLASTYGWRETDILEMSAARREYYLGLGR